MEKRLLQYWGKSATHQLSPGGDYTEFSRVITIVIADFNLVKDSDYYHNRYMLYDKEHDSLFTDLLEFVIIELPKWSENAEHTERWKWAKFFKSSSDAELQEAASESEMISKAMLTIEKLSADDAAWMKATYEDKQRRDHVARMNGARKEGLAEGETIGRAKGRAEICAEIANRLAELGKSEEDIAEILGASVK
jgi:predicted transposase/invertase (TIGR01784 family)